MVVADPGVVFGGDWRELPDSVCGGTVEVMDQTIGCDECGMNLWYLPSEDQFPSWVHLRPEHFPAVKLFVTGGVPGNRYDPFIEVFNYVHPFQFTDAHDDGDEDDPWPGKELLIAALIGRTGTHG